MKKYIILFASLIITIIGLAHLGEAQSSAPLTVTEVDGSPIRTGIRKLIFSNGSVSISGQTATVTTGGGGGSINVNGGSVSSPNFNGSTPAAPAGGINTTWQVSGSSVSGYLDYGSTSAAYLRKPYIASDFGDTFTTNEYVGAAISSGTNNTAISTAIISPQHPGMVLLRSSTSANSGYRYFAQGNTGIRIGGGERADIIFRTPADLSTITYRFGFTDSGSSADAVDGCYFELSGSGAIVGKTANNSTRTTSSTIATLSTDTWYHGVITINSDATQVDYTIYSEAGSSLGTQSITTNIPTASGRETLIGIVATSSGTTAIDLAWIDYAAMQWTKALVRGQ